MREATAAARRRLLQGSSEGGTGDGQSAGFTMDCETGA